MTIELGNITPEDLGILRGRIPNAAIEHPEQWEARVDGDSRWIPYEDKLDNCWSVWDFRQMFDKTSTIEWRRRPAKKEREPRIWQGVSTVVNSTYDGGQVIVLDAGQKIACPVNVRYRLEELPAATAPNYRPCSRAEAEANPEWSQYRFRDASNATWSEWCPIIGNWIHPSRYYYEFRTRARSADDPKDHGPGAFITWQEARSRLRDGLPVQVFASPIWTELTNELPNPNDWSYRIPKADDEPKVEVPGTIISWQRAQERAKHGLPVECHSAYSKSWVIMTCSRTPDAYQDSWTYRIPLTEPMMQPEPVAEMTWKDADSWLRKDRMRVVLDNVKNAWQLDEDGLGVFNGSDSQPQLLSAWAPYRPLLPATQSQVALLAEVERLKRRIAGFESDALVYLERQRTLEQQLRDMTEAWDRAVGELANERTKVQCLRLALNQDSVSADSAIGSMQNIKNRVERVLNETAGKGQG